MRVSLIDADTLVWVIAYYNRENEVNDRTLIEMRTSIDSSLTELLLNTKADQYAGFVKGPVASFRHRMFPDYKANRPPSPDWLRVWKESIVLYLLGDTWKFEYANGIEVDDAIASADYQLFQQGHTPIVCSVDKDFNQIPGLHYNPKTKGITDISPGEAYLFLHRQLLTGDITDNIKGIPGVGPAKAKRILQGERIGGDTISSLTYQVLNAYVAHNKDHGIGIQDFAENAIKILLKRDLNLNFKMNEVPEKIKGRSQASPDTSSMSLFD